MPEQVPPSEKNAKILPTCRGRRHIVSPRAQLVGCTFFHDSCTSGVVTVTLSSYAAVLHALLPISAYCILSTVLFFFNSPESSIRLLHNPIDASVLRSCTCVLRTLLFSLLYPSDCTDALFPACNRTAMLTNAFCMPDMHAYYASKSLTRQRLDISRNSTIADKPRDAFVQMRWRG